jgi:hypothetical protein
VVQDVDLPQGQQDFARQFVHRTVRAARPPP